MLTNGLAGVTTGATNASANATIALTAVGSEPKRPVMINGLTAPRNISAVRLIDAGLGCNASA